MSLFKFDFQITLEDSFVLVFVLARQSSNSDAGRRARSRTIFSFLFVSYAIVSLTALQNHSSGKFNISVLMLLTLTCFSLEECRYCR